MTGPRVLRLRRGVAATPMPTGLHLRGWDSGLTIEGGRGLWSVWQWLAPQLGAGVPLHRMGTLTARFDLQRAADVLIAQLQAADLLVEGTLDPVVDSPVTAWLDAAAPDPRLASELVGATRIDILGGPRELTDRMVTAAADCGMGAEVHAGPAGRVTLAMGARAVEVRVRGDAGFVTPVGSPAEVAALAGEVATRLVHTASSAPPILLSALGGAALHRLASTVADLPGPAAGPDCLVIRADPLTATYHPLRIDRAGSEPTTLDSALAGCAVLTDPELGLLPEPSTGGLPQHPAALAACTSGAGTVIGIGSTGQNARLQAILGAAGDALRLRPDDAAVGADLTHAAGILLRRRVDALVGAGILGDPSNVDWAADRAARRWWRALTVRLGVTGRVRLRALPGAWHAEIGDGGDRRRTGAVEREPGTAVAMAALAAVGTHAAGGPRAGAHFSAICGACPPPAVAPADLADELGRWLWPAQTADAEPALQEALAAIVGARPCPLDPPGGQALTAAGLAVVELRP